MIKCHGYFTVAQERTFERRDSGRESFAGRNSGNDAKYEELIQKVPKCCTSVFATCSSLVNSRCCKWLQIY